MAEARGKTMVGRVVSDKMAKTVIVEVATRSRHPLYGKVVMRARRFKAHNEAPVAKAGDTVRIVESRPLSRDKRWRVAEIVKRGEVIEAIREKELESLVEKERVEKEARKEEERRRAAERLSRLAGEPEMEETTDEMADEEDEEDEEPLEDEAMDESEEAE
jgi:small subunit ribosomal protein S17